MTKLGVLALQNNTRRVGVETGRDAEFNIFTISQPKRPITTWPISPRPISRAGTAGNPRTRVIYSAAPNHSTLLISSPLRGASQTLSLKMSKRGKMRLLGFWFLLSFDYIVVWFVWTMLEQSNQTDHTFLSSSHEIKWIIYPEINHDVSNSLNFDLFITF